MKSDITPAEYELLLNEIVDQMTDAGMTLESVRTDSFLASAILKAALRRRGLSIVRTPSKRSEQ